MYFFSTHAPGCLFSEFNAIQYSFIQQDNQQWLSQEERKEMQQDYKVKYTQTTASPSTNSRQDECIMDVTHYFI